MSDVLDYGAEGAEGDQRYRRGQIRRSSDVCCRDHRWRWRACLSTLLRVFSVDSLRVVLSDVEKYFAPAMQNMHFHEDFVDTLSFFPLNTL